MRLNMSSSLRDILRVGRSFWTCAAIGLVGEKQCLCECLVEQGQVQAGYHRNAGDAKALRVKRGCGWTSVDMRPVRKRWGVNQDTSPF
jgi:hypothetical protein